MTERTIPRGWALASIGSLCTLQNGRAFKPTDWTPDGLPIVRIQNLNNPRAPFNRFNGHVEARFLIAPQDLLFAWSGTPGTSFGAHIWAGDRAILNQHIFKVQIREDLLDKSYVRFAINERLGALIDKAHGGAGLAHVTKGRFEETEVFLPPLPEQRRIVAKLDAVFAQTRAAKARLERLPALIEKLKRSILAAAFRGDLTADWRAANADVEGADVLLTDAAAERRRQWAAALQARGRSAAAASYDLPEPIDSSALPEIPSSWRWASLATLASIQGGVTKGQRREAGEPLRHVPYLRVANVQRGSLRLDEVLEIEATEREVAELALRPGDILLNEGGDRDKLGRGWIWEGQLPLCIHQNHVFRARLYSPALDPRLVSTWGNAFGQPWFVDEGKQTTNLASISKSKLSRFPVPVPPRAEQAILAERLFRLLSAAEAIAQRFAKATDRLRRAEQAALNKAFRGELVPQDPTDEPATFLLERIRAAKADEPAPTRRPRTPAAAPAPYVVPPTITLAQAAESGPLFKHAHDRQQRAATDTPPLDLVVAALQQSDGRLTAAAISQATGLDAPAVRQTLKDLIAAGQVRTHGKARGTAYEWTG